MAKALQFVGILLVACAFVSCDKPTENKTTFETFEDSYVLGLYNGVEMEASSIGFDDEVSERLYERKLRKVQIHIGSSTSDIPGVVYLLGKDSTNVYYLTTFDYESQQFSWKEIRNSNLNLHELVNVGGIPYSFDFESGLSLIQLDFTKENIVNRIPIFGASLSKNNRFSSDGEFIYTTANNQLIIIDPISGAAATRNIPPNNSLGTFGNFQHLRHAHDNLFTACRVGSDAIEVGYILVPDSGDVQHYPKSVVYNLEPTKTIIDAAYSTLFDEFYIGLYEEKTIDPYSIIKVNLYNQRYLLNVVEEPFQALQIGETIKVIER